MVSTGQQAFMKTELRARQIVVFSECECLVIPEAFSAGESVLRRERFAVPAALPVMLHPAQRHPCGAVSAVTTRSRMRVRFERTFAALTPGDRPEDASCIPPACHISRSFKPFGSTLA
jgi:hypothetical protein